MTPENGIVNSEIAERFEDLVNHKSTNLLQPSSFSSHNYRASRRPIRSPGYAGCNAVVLLSSHVVGLSHYSLLYKEHPESYLPGLIEEILDDSVNVGDLSAVLVGGNAIHFQRNKKILDGYDIPVTGGYLDYHGTPDNRVPDLSWLDDCNILTNPIKKIEHKHVIVIPDTQEVLMYSKPVGYVKLA